MDDSPTQDLSPEAEEAYARYLLEKRHGASKSVDQLYSSNPGLAGELREIHSRWTSRKSLAERLKEERGVDLTAASISLQDDAPDSGPSSATPQKLQALDASGRVYFTMQLVKGRDLE
jgi:hypothetical protein